MDNLIFAFNALAPLLALALIGYTLRYTRILNDTFISYLNTFIFVIALPVLIFMGMATIDNLGHLNWSVVWFSVIMLLIITLLGLIGLHFWYTEEDYKPVILQAIFRGNFVIIGIPLALRLGGEEALSVIIILNAFLIPITNTFSILTFQLYGEKVSLNWQKIRMLLKRSFFNPLMIAIYLGIVALMLDTQWAWIETHIQVIPETLEMIGQTAVPMALIAIGGRFSFTRVKVFKLPLFIAVFARLIIVPLFVFAIAIALKNHIDFDYAWAALIAIFASPVAVASVAVTKGMKGNDEFASQIVLWTTLLAIFTLFVIVIIFKSLGFL